MDDMYTTDRKAVRKFKPVYYPDCARLCQIVSMLNAKNL